MAEPHPADIRGYLTAAYNDEELTTLCSDYFRDVYENFAAGMTKGQKIQLLLDRCQRRGTLPDLLAALERDRPGQYRRRFGAPAAEARPMPSIPVRDPRQVFVSHAHEDAGLAHRLAADLQANGWRAWLAPDSIRPGEKWVEAIERGLEESGAFVVLLTPAAVGSRWVKTETDLAIELEHRDVLQFIPVEVEACRVPLVWNTYQRISFIGKYEDGLTSLLKALQRPLAHPPPEAGKFLRVNLLHSDPATHAATARTQAAALRANLLHPDPATRAEAARALARLGAADAETVAALLRLYPDDPADAARHAALEALLALGRHADVGMVLVPAGEFLMGSADDDREAEKDERPQQRVYLPAYALDRTPVTNAQYRRFIAAGGYGNPAYWKEAAAAGRWKDGAYLDYYQDNKPQTEPRLWKDSRFNGDQQPVVGISWYEALAYARWAGKRLPTEAEWEKAASWAEGQGGGGARGQGRKLRYPWGDEWDAKRCNTKEAGPGRTTPVGAYSPALHPELVEGGDSPYGAADMAGNVFEWCSSAYRGYPYDPNDGREELGGGDVGRVLRGGSWYTDRKWVRCAFRHWLGPWLRLSLRGVRCCCSTSSLVSGSGS